MNRLFSEINNCYTLRYSEASVKYKKKYLDILDKMSKLNLIRYYTIEKNYISIFLRYWYNKPLFILQNHYFKSHLKCMKLKLLKSRYTINGGLQLYTTSLGVLTLEEMIIKNLGGKLLVDIKLNCKNIF